LIGLNVINVLQSVAYQKTGKIVGGRLRIQKSGRDLQGTGIGTLIFIKSDQLLQFLSKIKFRWAKRLVPKNVFTLRHESPRACLLSTILFLYKVIL